MQSAGGLKTLKEVVFEFKIFRNDVTTSFVALLTENVELKEQLREAIHLLCRFTSGESNLVLLSQYVHLNMVLTIQHATMRGNKSMKPFSGNSMRFMLMGW